MDDNQIIELYLQRNENAIQETVEAYGKKLDRLSLCIIKNSEDSEECVNDTYLKAWGNIPPQKPTYFFAYLAKICRFLCYGKIDYNNAKKRNANVITLTSELEQCISITNTKEIEAKELGEILTVFLKCVSEEQRLIFMRRYWFFDSIAEISKRYCISESKVKTTLFRTRNKLKVHLKKEGISI